MYKVKLKFRKEPWEDTGRTIYVSKAEYPTQTNVRDLMRETLTKDWSVDAIELMK